MRQLLRRIRGDQPGKTRRSRPARWPWAAGAFAVIVGILLVDYSAGALARSEVFRIQTITIAGHQRLDASRIEIEVVKLYGTPIFDLDLDDLREHLQKIPTVEHALVARRLPDTLDIRIDERRALARIPFRSGTLMVDSAGFLFPQGRQSPSDGDLPEIRGLRTVPGSKQLVSGDRPGLAAIEALWNVNGRPPPGTTIDLTPKDKIVVRPGENSPQMWLDRDEPARNLESLFAWKNSIHELSSDRGENRSVDLRTPHRLNLVPRDGTAAR